MDFTAVLAGVGAILTAAGGTTLVIREFRRRDHRASNREINMLTDDLHQCREDEIRWRNYAHTLRELLADHGVETTEPP